MTAAKATLPQVTDQTAPEVPPPVPVGGRTSEKTRARLSDLRPHPRNPRRISPARLVQLQRTLEAEPDMLEARPIIALPDGTVVAGNQRLAAAAALGWESIPVVYADLSPEEVTRWMLLDNRGFGEDDRDAVALLLGELEAADSDLELTGYDPADLDAMLRELHRPAADPDDAPPLPVEAKSRLGEVYELGPHRLMCGDACDEAAVRALVGSCAPEVLWTDPPYGVDLYVGMSPEEARRQRKRTDGKVVSNDGAADSTAVLRAGFAAADQVLAAKARFYVAAPAGPRHADFLAALAEIGWVLHETLVWIKDVFVLGHADYHYRHEPILYGWKRGTGRTGRGAHEGSRWYGGNARDTVFEIPRPKRSAEHPTMKPVELIESHLVNSSRRSDGVLDPFAGSGSTLIACESLGRRCFAMEIDPAYCDVIRQRYADYVGRPELAP